MSVVALVDPETLLGQGVRGGLGSSQSIQEVRLLASSAEAEGTLTEIGDEVSLVHTLTGESLADVDLAILCGSAEQQLAAIDLLAEGTQIIAFDAGPGSPEGPIGVAGITETATLGSPIVVSPHPGVVALCHLLAPLATWRLSRVAATLLLPTSVYNEPGLDELFGQTRSILSFQGELPTDVFPGQLAFNLLPRAAGPIGKRTAEVLGVDAAISTQVLQAPVFHSLSLSAYVELAQPLSAKEVRDALDSSSYIESADSTATLGPIDAAAREEILVGRIEAVEDSPSAFWLWAVMDNLTRGGATNAVELAEQILAQGD